MIDDRETVTVRAQRPREISTALLAATLLNPSTARA